MQTIPEKARERVIYFDAIKVFAIYLVCIYHYNNLGVDILQKSNFGVYLNYFFYGISSIAVPLFFMVNGALLLNRPYRLGKHLKKTLYLYILLNIWSFLSLLIFIPIEGISYSWKEFASAWFSLKLHVSNHLWFLQALISVYLLFPFIKEIYDLPDRKLLKLFCSIIFFFSFGNFFIHTFLNVVEFLLGVNYINSINFDFFPKINPFGGFSYACIYFVLGGYIADQVSKDRLKIKKIKLIISFLAGGFTLFLYGVLMTSSNDMFYDTVWDGYYSVMTLVMSVSIFLLFASFVYKSKQINQILQTIGTSTFGIYLVHRFFGALTIPYFQRLPFSNGLFLNLLYSLFVVFISLLLEQFMRRLPLVKKIISI